MQATKLESGGVRLVPFSSSDQDLVRRMQDDPDLYALWVRPIDWFGRQVADLLETSVNEEDDERGFAMWKVVSGEEAFQGWAAIVPFEDTSEIAIDFRLSGNAIHNDEHLPEKVCAVLSEWFFDNTYFSHLISIVRTDNAQMRKGLMAAGFRHRESKSVHGVPADIFQMLSPSMQSYVLTA